MNCGAGERAVEALKEMDQQIIPWFQSAAGELLKDMPAEKALALALAKITGNTELKVTMPVVHAPCIAQRQLKSDMVLVRMFLLIRFCCWSDVCSDDEHV